MQSFFKSCSTSLHLSVYTTKIVVLLLNIDIQLSNYECRRNSRSYSRYNKLNRYEQYCVDTLIFIKCKLSLTVTAVLLANTFVIGIFIPTLGILPITNVSGSIYLFSQN